MRRAASSVPTRERRRRCWWRRECDRGDKIAPMLRDPFAVDDPALLDVVARAPGPAGSLPITAEMLRVWPSGQIFGWSQNAGMGWEPSALGAREFLVLSTHGGVRAPDGSPIALGFHTGHWEVGLLVEEAARA